MTMNGKEQTTKRDYQVAIVGAGPMGLEMAVALKREGVDYIQFDANQMGHSLTWWPRNTNFFSTTERLAIAGVPIQNNHQQRITGEEYLAYLRGVVEQFDLQVNAFEPVMAIEREPAGFRLETAPQSGPQTYYAEKIILAIGDMHWSNDLNIPGEDLPHASHYFRDPHDYFRRRLLIVGGKNSAAETALRCWRAGARVAISYRRAKLDDKRIKHWLMPDLEAQFEAGNITYLASTVPVEITPDHVVLMPTDESGRPIAGAEPIIHETDHVLFHTGFRGDQSLLQSLGVILEGENRTPKFDPETMETNVPDIYLVGTVAAGVQQRYRIFIENSHHHIGKVTQAITGRWPDGLGDIPAKNYTLRFEQYEAN